MREGKWKLNGGLCGDLETVRFALMVQALKQYLIWAQIGSMQSCGCRFSDVGDFPGFQMISGPWFRGALEREAGK